MRLLVFRFSAMGDVALLSPVISSLARKYSSLSITLVTRKAFEPFFYNVPGVEVIGVDVDQEYRGIRGLYRLFRELCKLGPYTRGIDVHASTRSRILKLFFYFLTGLRFETIVKGRREKKAMIRSQNKILQPLPHVVDRYMRVFERAGLEAPVGRAPWINPDTQARALARSFLVGEKVEKKNGPWIGIAPFARHLQKTWPLASVRELMRLILNNPDYKVFLFGGGQRELEALRMLHNEFPQAHLVAGKLNLEGEMALVMRMDLMVVMDSFNMHMATLLGIPVLSIWGATHHYSGFGPYGQGPEAIVEVPLEKLPCRPCSVFGNKPCSRGDLACLNWIQPAYVYRRLEERLAEKRLRAQSA